MNNNIIYCLKCPFTFNVHYIGKSTLGLIRPIQHLTRSHSIKIREWVNDLNMLGYSPLIEILEKNIDIDELNDKELYWIDYYKSKGSLLLNMNLVTHNDLNEININVDNDYNYNIINELSKKIKNIRKLNKLTQAEYADKMGVGLRWLRKIESGKSDSLMLSNIISLLHKHKLTITISELKYDKNDIATNKTERV